MNYFDTKFTVQRRVAAEIRLFLLEHHILKSSPVAMETNMLSA